jgi:hypothetical protein
MTPTTPVSDDELYEKVYRFCRTEQAAHNLVALIKQERKKWAKGLLERLPEKQEIVTLTEPPLGIDRLWLEGRDTGVTAGYNQALTEVKSIIKESIGE